MSIPHERGAGQATQEVDKTFLGTGTQFNCLLPPLVSRCKWEGERMVQKWSRNGSGFVKTRGVLATYITGSTGYGPWLQQSWSAEVVTQ